MLYYCLQHFLSNILCLYLKRLPSHFEDETEEKYFNQPVELCCAAFTVKWTVCYCWWCCITKTLNLNYNLDIYFISDLLFDQDVKSPCKKSILPFFVQLLNYWCWNWWPSRFVFRRVMRCSNGDVSKCRVIWISECKDGWFLERVWNCSDV